MHKRILTALLAVLAPSLPAAAQVTLVVSSGDGTSSSGRVVGIDAVCTVQGRFSVHARTDSPDPGRRQVLFWFIIAVDQPGVVGFRGREVDRVRTGGCTLSGHKVLILEGLDVEVLLNINSAYESALLISSHPATDLGLPVSTTYAHFERVGIKGQRFTLSGPS